jgi:hypothetical protein
MNISGFIDELSAASNEAIEILFESFNFSKQSK